jgi:2-polyprenyl-6-methoxyphenol hydroxylase-like FAD-dependent oxidoreductase
VLNRFGRVVVAGAGIAGLAAAAAFARVADEVVILDRDALPDGVEARRGVPQGAHLHNLLGRAQQELDCLFPDFLDHLRSVGCADASVADETHVFELGRRMPERPLGLRLLSASRPVIEDVAQRIVRTFPNVGLYGSASVVGFAVGPAGSVTGSRVHVDGSSSMLPCDALVDATGAAGSGPRWLDDLGRARPRAELRRSRRWYVSTVVDRAPEQCGDPSFWLTFASPPHSRTGLISPLDQTRWWVSASGEQDDPVPSTFADVVAHAHALQDEAIGEQLERAIGGSPPRVYRREMARWRRYEELKNPVPGFFPIGDALAVLDPLYGQGMSVAAWQASALLNLLLDDTGDLLDLTIAHLRLAAAAVGVAWNVGALVDCGQSSVDKSAHLSSTDLGNLISTSTELHRTYVEIWHLLRPATELPRAVGAARDALVGLRP